MGDFFDINNDGKLDPFDQAMKDAHILNCVEELEKESSAPVHHSSPPKNDFNSKSAGDHFLVAFGAGILAVGAGFLGYFTISFSSFLGGTGFLAAIVLGIFTLYYIIKGIGLAMAVERHKSPETGRKSRKGIIIGVIIIALAIAGIVIFAGTRKSASSDSDQQQSVTGKSSKQNKSSDPVAKEVTEAKEKTTEKSTEKKDRWDDYPKKYRKVFRAAESEELVPSFYGSDAKKNYLEWINELKLPGNAFAEFIAKKREALNLGNLNPRDRAIVYLLICETVYGHFDPKNQKIQAVVATGYSADGKSDKENKLTYGKDNYWYARAIYMNDDKNIYLYYGQGLVKGHGSIKDDDIEMVFNLEIDGPYASNFVDMYKFRKNGHVTPENVTESFGASSKPKYSKVKFKMSKDLKELLYVFGVYAREIVYPREEAKEAAKKAAEQKSSGSGKSQGSSSGSSKAGSSSKNGTGSKSGSSSGKTTKKEIDPDDLDVEGYYEDYKDEFEDIDDAWDDLMDNPDLWEDYD